jgi:HAMP domain-containing protein
MRIAQKFNLVFSAVFGVLVLLAGLACYHLLQLNARNEVLNQARLMMQAAAAMRNYTDKQIKPLVGVRRTHEFHAQWVPAYAATQLFDYLREKYPEYTYKEATLNPTNPRDRAVDWEADVVNTFRNNRGEHQFVGERDFVTGPSLYLAQPIVVGPSCLECHSTPDAAPRPMLAKYIVPNGFGWRLNEIVGAQIVSVPASAATKLTQSALHALITALICFALITLISINIVLGLLVVRPLGRITAAAEEVTQGRLDIADLQVKGKDEVATLADAFNRMRRSLLGAMNVGQR